MILTENIKNKILLYIPEKICPVCDKKLNKFCNNNYCSFLCFIKFQIGLIEFIISFLYFFIIFFVAMCHLNLVNIFLTVNIILILFDLWKLFYNSI